MRPVITHIAVLVPARDEEELLPRCLRSLQAARARLPPHVTSDLVVVSDGSNDQTWPLATRMLGDGGVALAATMGVVGAARALAASSALQRLPGRPGQCWLANTDADCEVPSDWLTRQLALAACDLDAVAGIVDVNDFRGHEPHVRERFRRSYTIHPDGTHPHVHGANLGVRADAYLRAGGWSPLAHSEDHHLWGRLADAGCTRVADASLVVVTSGRRVGRAPHGFADALAAHNDHARSLRRSTGDVAAARDIPAVQSRHSR